jgi:hypothetical protein
MRRAVRMVGSIIMGCLMAGCGRRPSVPDASPPRPPVAANASQPAARVSRDKLLESALAVLDRLDDFDEARGAELVFDRINQWARLLPAGAADDWRPDPLVDALPERLREPLARIAPDAASFSAAGDVLYLRDQRWLADIARIARGEARDDLEVARALFAWTVRSLALVGDPPMAPTESNPGTRWYQPGEILLAGRASGPQRSWVFLQLARHAGLDAVLLATGDAADGTLRGWVPAIVSAGELHLFDPVYAMPIPGPGGEGVATLREAVADPGVLGALSLPDRPYPVTADDLARLTVLVAADPWALSRRMALLDPEVRGAREMRVAVEPSRVGALAVAAVEQAGVTAAPPRLWDFPWETIARRRSDPRVGEAVGRELAPLQVPFVPRRGSAQPELLRPLLAGRLREFRGEWDGPQGAKAAYLEARASRAAVATAVAQIPAEQAEPARALFGRMKEDAAYWLGILTLAEGEYETAIDYLGRMTVEGAPDSRWTDAARTNLAQALIAVGRTDDAVVALRADLSPQRFGSRVLADRLAAPTGRSKPPAGGAADDVGPQSDAPAPPR